MITPEMIKEAYDAFLAADEAQFQAEEDRIQNAIARDARYLEAINEAQADGITDPARQQQKAQKATKAELMWLNESEKASRKAAHEYRQAGIRVDSLVKQMEAEKQARQ